MCVVNEQGKENYSEISKMVSNNDNILYNLYCQLLIQKVE